jgi:DHA1 family tetracycline resistance protein-like MFS transporter
MVFPVTIVGALQALTFPAVNALMSQRVSADQQGELQGAIASLMSLSSIIGPFLMTQSLAAFTAPSAPVHFPGAPFIVATLLTGIGFVFLLVRTPPEPIVHGSPAAGSEP